MSSLLIPVSVAAKYVKTETGVPSLSGQPFNSDAKLEVGMHVNWALPDALTRAKTLGGGTANQSIIFPGVPDLWLVTRFNPAPLANAASPLRTWKAWVVNSRLQTVTILDKWTAPAPDNAALVHTLPGVLPAAVSEGYPGWGVWDGSKTDFDAAITSAIYYPSARTRFGLYDDLSDAPTTGNIGYTVVGWYSATSNDPLYNSANRGKQIADWLLSYDPHLSLSELIPLLATNPAASTWKPTLTIASQPATQPSSTARLDLAAQQTAERTARLAVVQAALGTGAFVASTVLTDKNPIEIVCHGCMTDIPLGTLSADAAVLTPAQFELHPHLKRALASTTAATTNASTLDYSEALLQDLDNQRDTVAGIVDLPGATQALTFQGLPGLGTYFAQIQISPPQLLFLNDFSLTAVDEGVSATGHWPVFAREQRVVDTNIVTTGATGDAGITAAAAAAAAAAQQAIEQTASDNWVKQVRAAFQTTLTAAQAAGTPIDPNLIKVSDSRPNAQPLRLSPSVGGSGNDSGSWWISSGDDDALAQIFASTTGTTAVVSMPSVTALYMQPGPRWYRPWSPQVVLNDVGRSYRFGEDGRFDPVNGTLLCRTSGYTIVSIYASNGTPVSGSQILASPAGISSLKALPAEALSLLNEAVLLNTSSAVSMAAVSAPAASRAAAQSYFQAAIRGLYIARLTDLTAEQLAAIAKVRISGDAPSPLAISPWGSDQWDPLFLDSSYTYTESLLESGWQLQEDYVELTPSGSVDTGGKVEVFNDRTRLTATIPKVLESALVTRRTNDPQGNPVVRQTPPSGLTQEVFQAKETISAPLVHTLLTNTPGSLYGAFDDALMARGYRSRAGTLSVTQLSMVDVFGATKQWTVPANTLAPSIPLTPRLPFWARLDFRLQAASDVTIEADSGNSSICGILLPDFLDHSLQVYDGSGNALGQLTCDRARFGEGASATATTLQVNFLAYPWVLTQMNVTSSDPTTIVNQVIANVSLRSFVLGVMQQSMAVPAAASPSVWYETGLTAMMRAIDSVRATLDPSAKTSDRKVSLLGEPILVMVGRVTFQTNNATSAAAVATGSPLPATPPVPPISVRIGDITRPDDGVLGFFNPSDSPADSCFAPVSIDAANKAMINTLSLSFSFNTTVGVPVNHPFVKNQVNVISVPPDTPTNVIMLTDIRGCMYATSGVLPRKKIRVPKDFLDASLANMEPVFSVGPILTVPGTLPTDIKPMIPPPLVQGYDADFVSSAAAAGNPPPEVAMPVSAPIGDMAPTRVTMSEGWVIMRQHKS